MNAPHSHLKTFLKHNPAFRQVLGQRYPVLTSTPSTRCSAIITSTRPAGRGLPPWPIEDLIEHYQTIPDAWRERAPPMPPGEEHADGKL